MALRPMLLVRSPLEVMSTPGFWEELQDAGIQEVVVGWLELLQEGAEDGVPYPLEHTYRRRVLDYFGGRTVRCKVVGSFRPTRELYSDTAIRPPDMPGGMEKKAQALAKALQEGADRGFKIYAFNTDTGTWPEELGEQGCFNNPHRLTYVVARARDYKRHYPAMAGIVLDGPDYRWEIKPEHRDDLFLRFCTCRYCQEAAGAMGLDLLSIKASLDQVRERLHRLTPQAVVSFLKTQRGIADALDWVFSEPDMLDLLRFRMATVEQHLKGVYQRIKAHMPDFQVGVGSRTPALTPLTGHNLRRTREYSDFQLPKLYLWMGGVAGFRGTVYNYVRTLMDWNPGLTEELCVRLVEHLFGVKLPSDYPPQDYSKEATDRFFSETVAGEIQKMLYLTGGPEKLSPWVGQEHFGSLWVTPGELRRLLEVMAEQGLTRYTYFVYHEMTDEVWNMVKEFATR